MGKSFMGRHEGCNRRTAQSEGRGSSQRAEEAVRVWRKQSEGGGSSQKQIQSLVFVILSYNVCDTCVSLMF